MTRDERSYIVPGLTSDDRKLLAGVPRNASLGEEIGFLRLRIRKLIESDEAGADDRLMRMLTLLTRMVGVQSRLAEPAVDELAELNELVRQRLVAAEPGSRLQETGDRGRAGDRAR